MNIDLATRLIQTLPSSAPGLFNPWMERCSFDADGNGPEQRTERLAQHLDCTARLILVGEAPGYQGCRYSGVGFTSERLLMEGAIPRVACNGRLSSRRLPFSEPSATIVWKALYRHGLADSTILWNALQLHPFRAEPWTNRTPTPAELAYGVPALKLLRDAFPEAVLVAVGRKAEQALAELGVSVGAAVRHPANGGATEFAEGLARLVTK